MCSGIEITPQKIHFKEKQKMKKLGLIILMALVLTVGGVYATFNYAHADVDSKSATLNKGIAGTGDTPIAKGTIAIDVEGFILKIDDTTSTLTTGLETQGHVKVTFTPAKGADASVAAEGINLKLEISFTNNTYRQGTVDYAVFKTTAAYGTGVTLAANTATKNGNAFEYMVDLSPYFTVSEIPLPTLADYNAFKTFFTNQENAKITVTVSEAE